MTDLPDQRIPELKGLIDQGVSSFKMFMAYPGVFLVDDGTIFKAMSAAGERGGLICMHAENGVVIDVLVIAVVLSHPRPQASARIAYNTVLTLFAVLMVVYWVEGRGS